MNSGKLPEIIKISFLDDAERVFEHYSCPCDDASNPDCECYAVADQFLTDYTWYCNQRYALREGRQADRASPIFSSLITQTRPKALNDPYATHGIGEYLFFGSWLGIT